MLSERDVAELRESLDRRDIHNRRLYAEIATLQSHLDRSFTTRLFSAIRRMIGRARSG